MWIDMLRDFDFKIIHKIRPKHGDVDALSRNPVSLVADNEDFVNEIQDMKMLKITGIHTWIWRKCFRHMK